MSAAIDCISINDCSPLGDLAATGRSHFTGRYWTGYISVLLPEANQEGISADLRAGVGAISWLDKEGKAEAPILVSGSDDGSVDLWQCSLEEKHLDHLEGKAAHDHIVSSVSAPSTGHVIATASWDLRVQVWDTIAFLESTASFVGHTDLVHSVCWAGTESSSQTLVSASQDRTVRKWDVRDGRCSAVLRLEQPATAAAWCPESSLLVVGDELGSLTFFDVRKGNVQLACLHRLHHDAVRAITSPVRGSGTLLASAADDGRVCIIPKGQQISAVKQQVRIPHRDGYYIRALGYGQKGLYSASWDGRLECNADL